MFCTNCGTELADGTAFCTSCGAKLGNASSEDATPAASVRASQPVVSAPVVPAAKKKTTGNSKASSKAVADYAKRSDAASGQETGEKQGVSKGLLIGVIAAGVALLVAIAALVFVLIGPDIEDLFPSSAPAQSESINARESRASETNTEDADASQAKNESSSNAATASTANEVVPAQEAATATSEYLLPDSATRAYSAAELEDMSNEELFIARNEVFARHGRGFLNPILIEHFNAQPWYTERYSPEEFDSMPSPLSDIERANVTTIRSIEESRNSPYLA